MAEGVSNGAQPAEPTVVEEREDTVAEMPDVSGHWWHSSPLTGPAGQQVQTPPHSGVQFQGWREWQWTEDEDGE